MGWSRWQGHLQNLQLSSSWQYNLDAVFEAFERYCNAICNFRVARFKFNIVKQHETETIHSTIAYCVWQGNASLKTLMSI